jgi:hypothetical protein
MPQRKNATDIHKKNAEFVEFQQTLLHTITRIGLGLSPSQCRGMSELTSKYHFENDKNVIVRSKQNPKPSRSKLGQRRKGPGLNLSHPWPQVKQKKIEHGSNHRR